MYRFLQKLGTATLVLAAAGFARGGEGADKSSYSLWHPVPVERLRELSTDRPDQTESPYTVDAGHFQLEMDLVNYTRDRADGVTATELAVAPLNLKLGLANRVDLQLMVDPFVRARIKDPLTGTTTASGFGDVTTRVKFNLWGNDGGPTAAAIMPFVKWPLSASDVRNGKTEGGVIGILGYELAGGWGSAFMTEVDWVRDEAGGRRTEWVNSITFSHDLGDRLGGYFEFFTVTGPDTAWQVQFDLGLTYAVSPNTQLDLGCNIGITRSAPDCQPFVGVSRRF